MHTDTQCDGCGLLCTALADLGLQIEPSFLITDFTVGYVQGLERGDRITMVKTCGISFKITTSSWSVTFTLCCV